MFRCAGVAAGIVLLSVVSGGLRPSMAWAQDSDWMSGLRPLDRPAIVPAPASRPALRKPAAPKAAAKPATAPARAEAPLLPRREQSLPHRVLAGPVVRPATRHPAPAAGRPLALPSTAVTPAAPAPSASTLEAAEAAFARGQHAYRRGRFESAVAELNEALRLQPRFVEAASLRGMAYLRDGAFERAAEAFSHLLAGDAGSGSALLGRTAALLELGRHREAFDTADRLVALKPQSKAGWIELGRVHELAGRHDQAVAAYSEALTRAPRDPLVLYHRGHVRLRAGEAAAARADLDAAVAIEPRLAGVSGILRQSPYLGAPGRTDIWEEPGGALVLAPRPEAPTAARLAPPPTGGAAPAAFATLGEPRVDAALLGATSALAARSYDKAIADAGDALRANPRSAAAYLVRGTAYLFRKQCDRATADLDEAIRLDPGLADAFVMRGECYTQLFRLERALADFEEALRLRPDSAAGLRGRGFVLLMRGNVEGALGDLDRSLEMDRSSHTTFYIRGLALTRVARHQAAVRDFDEAIRLSPTDIAAWRARAGVSLALGDHAAAIRDLDRVVELEPHNAMNLVDRGNALERSGATARAREDYQRALAAAPKGSRAHTAAQERLKRISGSGI